MREASSNQQSYESPLTFPKTVELATEFGLKAPSQETLQQVIALMDRGFPFVKSIETPALEYLLEAGELINAREMDTGDFDVIYASTVFGKAYGAWTLSLDPELIKNSSYNAYMVDHASTYVTHQEEVRGVSREEVMERYTLTPQEFIQIYQYTLASYLDFPFYKYGSEQNENFLTFITFDIGLPVIHIGDIKHLYYKNGYGGRKEDLPEIKKKAIAHGLAIEVVRNSLPELAGKICDVHKIPRTYLQAITKIAS